MTAPAGSSAALPNVFSHRPFALYWTSRLVSVFAIQILSVAVGWQVYDLTRDPLQLGLVGLVQFAPAFALVLVTGSVADHFPRVLVIATCLFVEAACALGMLLFSLSGSPDVTIVFAILLAFGVARAFLSPAQSSLLPNLVPREQLGSAIAYNSSSWQIGTIVGPVIGGLLYGISAEVAYGTAGILLLLAFILISLVSRPPQQRTGDARNWTTLVAGFRYVWHKKIVLGAISLDLFAVLFGGATALLPVYARDVLEVGPWGLGLLRAGPGIGALIVAVWLGFYPIKDRAGVTMFLFVGLFGVFTALFGASTVVWLSVAALALAGAADMISVYIRETLIQLATPDEVRGRVSAVNSLFIGASNEMGEFRAGVFAAVIGAVPAVILGGMATIGIAMLWPYLFPELWRARRLDGT